MNTEQLIKEAAEAYDGSGMSDETFSGIVDFFLTHAKTQGWELVKVEGEELAQEFLKGLISSWHHDDEIGELISKAIAIGREQGRKEGRK